MATDNVFSTKRTWRNLNEVHEEPPVKCAENVETIKAVELTLPPVGMSRLFMEYRIVFSKYIVLILLADEK